MTEDTDEPGGSSLSVTYDTAPDQNDHPQEQEQSSEQQAPQEDTVTTPVKSNNCHNNNNQYVDNVDHHQQISPSSTNSSPDRSMSPPFSLDGAGHAFPFIHRVKVYILANDDWSDLGTGRCGILSTPVIRPHTTNENPLDIEEEDMNEGPYIVVIDERSKPSESEQGPPHIILHCSMHSVYYHAASTASVAYKECGKENTLEAAEWLGLKGLEKGGSFVRQQGTLIVWTEPDGRDMALSFANPQGCEEIWNAIESARCSFFPDDDFFSSPPPEGGSWVGFTDGLPEPSLINLRDLELGIRYGSKTAQGRERISSEMVKSRFIDKLIPLKDEAEAVESLADLHLLCTLVQLIILLNDHVLIEYILRDEVYLGVVAILEYDPQFHGMRASYCSQVGDPNNFKEVIEIPNDFIRTRIHQTYRLKYLKDVILPRTLDDSTYTMFNSSIFFNETDIVTALRDDPKFLDDLFNIFADVEPKPRVESQDEESKPVLDEDQDSITDHQRDALVFLQQFCTMGKNLQQPHRTLFYNTLIDKGLLLVVRFALSLKHDLVARNAAIDILMIAVEHDSTTVRNHCITQHESGCHSLFIFMIDVLHHDSDIGLKAQLTEVVRILTQTIPDTLTLEQRQHYMRNRQDDPVLEKFLSYFYETCAPYLMKPILDLPSPDKIPETGLKLSNDQVSLCGHLCDLLCFFIAAHSYRSKYFILSSSVSEKITPLFRSKQKHLRLAALRYFRSIMGRNDDYINRNIIRNNFFDLIISICEKELENDNLLSSACLEMFEFLRFQTTSKSLVKHIVERHGTSIANFAKSFYTFQSLLARYDQWMEPPPLPEDQSGQELVSQERNGNAEDDEESYFNVTTSDEEDSGQLTTNVHGKTESPSNGRDESVTPEKKRQKRSSLSSAEAAVVQSPSLVFDNNVQQSYTQELSPGKNDTVLRGLVEYGDDDEDEQQSQTNEQAKDRQTPSKLSHDDKVENDDDLEELPSPLSMKKRRREQDDENEEDDKLGALARKQKTSVPKEDSLEKPGEERPQRGRRRSRTLVSNDSPSSTSPSSEKRSSGRLKINIGLQKKKP